MNRLGRVYVPVSEKLRRVVGRGPLDRVWLHLGCPFVAHWRTLRMAYLAVSDLVRRRDEEGGKMDIKVFCRRHGITISSELVGENPNFQDPTPGSWHWKVKLRRRRPRRQLGTFFTMGPALDREPEAEEVLDCLCSDASTVDQSRSFEDWCSDLGYDADSRKAEKTYKAVMAQTARLRVFLGAEFETAVYHMERR